MSVTLGNFRFSPSWSMSLLTVAIFVGLLRLGFWQLDRAAQKTQLIQEYTRAGEHASDIDDPEIGRFSRIKVSGKWDRQKLFFLDNMIHQTQAGFHVLVPLINPENGTAILANLGWTASTGRRDQLPSLAPLEQGLVEVTGRLNRLPKPGIRLDPGPTNTDDPWPRVVVFPVMEELEAQLGYSLYPFALFLEQQESSQYVREWQPVKLGSQRHLGYAIQWFSLSLALLVIYFVVNTKRVLK